jgi:glucose-1-phosphate thymidylyltransferase
LLGLAGTDGTLFAHKVDDPARFGVVTTDESGIARQLIEKPMAPSSDLAVVGLYHVSSGRRLADAIETLIEASSPDQGELYLIDVLQRMVDDGARFQVRPVQSWADCGVPADLLEANRKLLANVEHNATEAAHERTVARAPTFVHQGSDVIRCRIGPRVFIGPGCRLVDSTVGPDVSLAGEATIERSWIQNTVAESGVHLTDSQLSGCLLGAGVSVSGASGALNLEDGSTIHGER